MSGVIYCVFRSDFLFYTLCFLAIDVFIQIALNLIKHFSLLHATTLLINDFLKKSIIKINANDSPYSASLLTVSIKGGHIMLLKLIHARKEIELTRLEW